MSLNESMGRVTLIAAPVETAHIGDHGIGTLGLDFQRGNQSVLGLDHDAVAPAFNGDADGELRLHGSFPSLASPLARRSTLAKERAEAHDY
jgi:hypothetical protein